MRTEESALALIPARGGSRRIPGKNIRPFLGTPILAYAVRAALESGLFDTVMVSTDSEEIADCARALGASVPFLRSKDSAHDYATTDAVIAEVLRAYTERGLHFARFCCIYPTAVFVTKDMLAEAMLLLREHESVNPVVAFEAPPQRAFAIRDGRLFRKYPEYANTRSQDLETLYHDAGLFYACRTEAFLRENTTDTPDCVPLVVPSARAQDIDTEEDWRRAEEKYRLLHPEIT